MAPALGIITRLVAVLLAGLVSSLATADDGDHDRARRALEAGEILPLRTIIERVEYDYPGQIIEVELERDDGLWIYEIELLRATGALLKLKVDAGDGTLLGIKGRDLERSTPPEYQH
jgi:uncharacterized membrane protein YkoI